LKQIIELAYWCDLYTRPNYENVYELLMRGAKYDENGNLDSEFCSILIFFISITPIIVMGLTQKDSPIIGFSAK